ncbi:ribosomal protein S5 domain 2-like protein [Violaceomyces palustris]|uniref:Ribosomal protein S5 domain 2-like protein n=1 Tax=Violaceomyces palustris TaxID=1673888 RepID=A0ACD0NNS9_9BASI|nr:ribosomal protein S5 domain 2-like protein [Violaceomyces palustris]
MSVYDRRRVNAPESHPPIYSTQPKASTSARRLHSSNHRPDGRQPSQIRPIFLQTNLIPQSSGSCYIETGNLKIACAVYGPRQVKGRQYAGKAELNVELRFAPFSSKRRRKAGKGTESPILSSLIHQSLLPSLRLDLLPKASLDVHLTVLECDATEEGCIAAGTIAASTALACAGIEMYGLVVGGVAILPRKPSSTQETTVQSSKADSKESADLLMDPTLEDSNLPDTKQGTRILLCSMPALGSTTCLRITSGTGGEDVDQVEKALVVLNASLNEVHGVVAKAVSADFERRQRAHAGTLVEAA